MSRPVNPDTRTPAQYARDYRASRELRTLAVGADSRVHIATIRSRDRDSSDRAVVERALRELAERDPAPHGPGMKELPLSLATIGYEGALLDDFVATLKSSSVRTLIDVRELPISRRKGFAKTALSAALKAADIQYVHLKGLGDPKPGRDAARAGDHAKFLKVFRAHMLTTSAQFDLVVAASHVASGGACLMCFERDHATCHRALVAEAIHATTPIQIHHIGVRNGLAAFSKERTRPAAPVRA